MSQFTREDMTTLLLLLGIQVLAMFADYATR